MAQFQLNILGCGSAIPTARHNPSSQIIDIRDNLFMIDCGEGSQLTMRKMRLKYARLNNIFISHLHGDHCLGLTGLLSSMALQEKSGTLTIHIFEEGADLFDQQLKFFCRDTPYEIKFNIIKPERATIFESNAITVETIPLFHRVPCVGFLFKEKPKLRHLKGDMVKFYEIPVKDIHGIKEGNDFITPQGVLVPNSHLTSDPSPSMSYAYCSDTAFNPQVAESVKGVNTIYHEATYTNEFISIAGKRGHSTSAQAAQIAKMAGAERLILGHFSKRYRDESGLLNEAKTIFDNTILANDGMRIDLL
ncbi:MAG: ribonuclease Z [Muribaculaceae bacterium]|nr:ribonuclease Z [Muribaculaceae bacterium]MBQ7855331.1 ribonuclease Z [Muribaculaceae bacterium]